MFRNIGRKYVFDNELEAEEKRIVRLFRDNAFILFENANRILEDDRMACAKLPARCYSFCSDPTLGAVVKMWIECPWAVRRFDNGKTGLLWSFSGNPMTGSNKCSYICEDGTTMSASLSSCVEPSAAPSFIEALKVFCEYSREFQGPAAKCVPCSLPEVVDLLLPEMSRRSV